MKHFWKEILEYGPRSVGTPAHDRVTDYIFNEMKKLSEHAYLDGFIFEGWLNHSPSFLRVTEPVERKLESFLFLGSGAGEFKGYMKKIGKNYVWNMYGWDLYAVVSEDEKIIAWISGRNEGGLLSQTLIEGNSDLPHLIIGEEENKWLNHLLQAGQVVKAEGKADCSAVPEMKGNNIVAPFRNGAPDQKDIILCAHYDSMYNTVGAYDNGAGAAVLMSLARRFSENPPKKNLVLIFTDGEECRLEGSKHFAKGVCPEQTEYVLNIDGIGRGQELEIWCGREPFARKIYELLAKYEEIPEKIIKWPPPPGSDHQPFYAKGIHTCMYTFNDQGILHTERDVYQESMLRNMEKMEKLVLYTLEYA